MTPTTKRKLQRLAEQLNVQVEDIEKPPFEIIDNTDDVQEPRPAAIVSGPGGRGGPSKSRRAGGGGQRRDDAFVGGGSNDAY